MTKWQQDHPPLSRRQVRDSARGEAASTPPGDEQRPDLPRPASRRDATGGRRVHWDPAGERRDAAEPLSYVTQSRVPAVDQGTEVQSPGTPTEAQAPFRVRDYRPEGRRASSTARSAADQPRQRSMADDSADDLDYRTQGGPDSELSLRVRDDTPTPAQKSDNPVVEPESTIVAPERTITRRELRALRERAAIAAGEKSDRPTPAIPDLIEPGIDRPIPATPRGAVPGIVDAGDIQAEVVQPGAPAVLEAELVESPAVANRENDSASGSESMSPFDSLFLPPSSRVSTGEGAGTERGVEPAPVAKTAPFGHWSTQGAPDPAVEGDAAHSRTVGVTTGAITTHALVLPSITDSSDHLLTPLTSTGEIMITGSIDLPRSFGSTGAHPALFDHPDVDAIIEQSDREDASSESAPVRAIRAVSSNSSARGVIEAPAPPKSRLPRIVGTAAGAALLVVASVIGAGFAFNVF